MFQIFHSWSNQLSELRTSQFLPYISNKIVFWRAREGQGRCWLPRICQEGQKFSLLTLQPLHPQKLNELIPKMAIFKAVSSPFPQGPSFCFIHSSIFQRVGRYTSKVTIDADLRCVWELEVDCTSESGLSCQAGLIVSCEEGFRVLSVFCRHGTVQVVNPRWSPSRNLLPCLTKEVTDVSLQTKHPNND